MTKRMGGQSPIQDENLIGLGSAQRNWALTPDQRSEVCIGDSWPLA